jgi:uncharacterized lipoprotein YbaY
VVVPSQVTGTLVYREPYVLSDQAYASVAVVQIIDGDVVVLGTARFDNPGAVPIPFQVRFNQAPVDMNVQAQLWAIVVDGDDAWVTPEGVPVATLGAPAADVLVPLSFRPDLLEGQVTGVTVGAGSDLSAEAVSMTYVLNATTLEIVGFDSRMVAGADPIPFAVAFSVADLDEGASYVASSFVYDGESTWDTDEGTPVITQGNPISDVTVTVSPVTAPAPSPSPTPIATPTPAPTATAAPTPPPDGGGGLDPLWLLLALAAIIGVIVVIFAMRRNQESGGEPPTQAGDDAGGEASSGGDASGGSDGGGD